MILDKIVAHKRKTLEHLKEVVSVASLEKLIANAEKPRGFGNALRRHENIALIAEVKRASPSAGTIRQNVDPAGIAKKYEAAGAAAISVLTDERFFQGSLSDMRTVKNTVTIPVFRKDFVLDPLQVYEARAYGADGILLIAAILSNEDLKTLLALCKALAFDSLVEVHTEEELSRAVDLGAEIIGINNRNLKTFSVDLSTTVKLISSIPEGTTCVSESGIQSRDDVVTLQNANVDAVLVGTALMKSQDIGGKIHMLLGK